MTVNKNKEGVTCVQVCPTDPQNPSPIVLAEKANQALQTELLRLNEFTGDGQVVNSLVDKLSCRLFTVCLFMQKSRPTCHKWPLGDLPPSWVGRLALQGSEKYSSLINHFLSLHCLFA